MSNIITDRTPADDVAYILQTLGYGTVGTDIFYAKEPDGDQIQDNIITCYDTAPYKSPEMNYNYEYPMVSCRVRCKSSSVRSGAQRTMAFMNALHGWNGTQGSNKYHMIKVANGPIPLGRDHRGRYRYTFNLEIQRST